MNTSTARKVYIERLRIMAMLSVVGIHIFLAAVNTFDQKQGYYYVLTYCLRGLLHFAVPVFFMISGALMLNPAKEMPIKKLCTRYILKYAAVIVVFGWAFAFLEQFFNTKSIKLVMFWDSFVNMLSGNTWDHMWYMYALMGAMLMIPVMRAIVKHFGDDEIKFFLIVGVIFLCILPIIKSYLKFSFGVELPFSSVYCLYMLVGYWIDSKKLRISSKAAIVIIAVSSLIIIASQVAYTVFDLPTKILVEYDSIIVAALSAALFALFKNNEEKMQEKGISKFGQLLSSCSFGVYILHMLWINVIYKLIKLNPFKFEPVIVTVGLWAVVVAASVLTTFVLKKIPLVRKML